MASIFSVGTAIVAIRQVPAFLRHCFPAIHTRQAGYTSQCHCHSQRRNAAETTSGVRRDGLLRRLRHPSAAASETPSIAMPASPQGGPRRGTLLRASSPHPCVRGTKRFPRLVCVPEASSSPPRRLSSWTAAKPPARSISGSADARRSEECLSPGDDLPREASPRPEEHARLGRAISSIAALFSRFRSANSRAAAAALWHAYR